MNYFPHMKLPKHLCCALLLVLGCSIDPFRTAFEETESAITYEAAAKSAAPTSIDTLSVMTWNIKFGGGRLVFFWECNGTRYNMKESEVLGHMESVAAKIREIDPDILLLQEVDIQSKRSAYVDQMQYMLNETDLNYGVYASIWKADYIPSHGLGRMNMGNAILSKWPLNEATRISLPIRTDQSALEDYFFFRRNVLKARVEIPGQNQFYACNVHTEPWSQDGTKQKHIDRFKDELDIIHNAGGLFIAGGDLNIVPPGSPKWKDFADDQCSDAMFKGDDYTGQEAWMDGLYASYAAAVPLDTIKTRPDKHYSFTGDQGVGWVRKLDFLFTNSSFANGSGTTLQDTLLPDGTIGTKSCLNLSDHAPIFAKMRLP